MWLRIVLNPGRPPTWSSGGKYVAPTKGFKSGVSHTLIGQPPPPVMACQNIKQPLLTQCFIQYYNCGFKCTLSGSVVEDGAEKKQEERGEKRKKKKRRKPSPKVKTWLANSDLVRYILKVIPGCMSYRLCPHQASPLGPLLQKQTCHWGSVQSLHFQRILFPLHDTNGKWNNPLERKRINLMKSTWDE